MDSQKKAVKPSNFIRNVIDEDHSSGNVRGIKALLATETNGYIHFLYTKSVSLYCRTSDKYCGSYNLCLDKKNPT